MITGRKYKENDFFLGDYQKLDGRLRFIFYSLLLFLGYQTFYNDILSNLKNTPEELFWPNGIFCLFDQIFTRDHYIKFIEYTRGLLVVCWFFSAIGFIGRFPILITGVLVFIYWGIFKASSGTGHTWHLPMYALVVLGLTIKPNNWSFDSYLSKKFRWYFFKIKKSSLEGYGLKIILMLSSYTLFAGGVSKLINGGLDWLSGESLYYYLIYLSDKKGIIGSSIYSVLIKNRFIITILSIWTIALELISILLLFLPKWRIFIFSNAWLFHIGIYYLLLPKYFPQMTVYLILINWDRIYTTNKVTRYSLMKFMFNLKPEKNQLISVSNHRKKFLKALYIFIAFMLIITIITQNEKYPLTHIPMYSNSITEKKLGNIPYDQLQTLPGLQSVGINYLYKNNPWYLKFYMTKMFVVEKFEGNCWVKDEHFLNNSVNKYLWAHRITISFFTDLKNANNLNECNFKNTSKIFYSVCKLKSSKLHLNSDYRLTLHLKSGIHIVSLYHGRK